MKIFKITLIIILLTSFVKAQNQLNQEVSVVKPYDPIISDAYKIKIMPELLDTNKILIHFDYKLFPKQYPIIFIPTPIKPAKMVAEPINKLYSTNIRFGYGLYNTIFSQIAVNTTRNKDYSAGLYYNHYSSRGKIKLDNDFKSPAFYSQNNLELYGKRFTEKATFYSNGNFNRMVLHHYGYDTQNDSLYQYTADSTKQRYMNFGAIIGYKTNFLDSTKINHSAQVGYQFLEDKFSNFQHQISVQGSANMLYRRQYIGADIKLDWNNINTQLDTNNNAIFSFFPWVRFFGNDWRINCGLALEVDAYTDSVFYHLYPRANIQYNVIENFLIPFGGFDGKMIANNLLSRYNENLYIKPGLHMKNTNQLMHLFAGFKGNFSKNISYLFKVSYSLYDNLPFYINDTTFFKHQFILVYDGVKGKETQEVAFNTEFSYKDKEHLNILLSGNYYKYTLVSYLKPYHKPEWDITFTARYNIKNKIITQLDIFTIGTRYAYNFVDPIHPIRLDPIYDLNLSFNYHYSKLFGAFIKFNNLLNKNYSYWYLYPVQRMQFLFGFSLTL